MGSNHDVRLPVLLLLGAIASFFLAFVLWPTGDADPGLPSQTSHAVPAPNTSSNERQDGMDRRDASGAVVRSTSHLGKLRIVVTTTSGAALASCQVKVGKRDVATTSETGVVEFEMRVGRHWIEVQPPLGSAYAVARQRVTTVAGEMVEASLALTTSGGGELWCRVVAAENGQPIEGANVLVCPYGGAESVTDQDGLVVLQTEGEHEFLVARAEGRSMRRFLSTVESFGDDGVIEVALPLAAELALEVVDADGEPVQGALVALAAMPWSLMHPARAAPRGTPENWAAETDAQGRCSFVDLPPVCLLGLEVTSIGGSHAMFREPVELRVGRNDKRIELSSLAAIVGRVLDVGGTPIAAARVAALRLYGDESVTVLPEEAQGVSAMSEDDGSFRIEGLDPGAYAVSLVGNELWASSTQRVELQAGGNAKAEIRAQAAQSITGTLTGPGNRAISAFEVHASRDGTLVGTSVTDNNGEFSIKGLPPGDYEITTELYDQELAMREPVVVPAGRVGVRVKVASVTGALRGRVIGGDSLRPDTFVRAQRRNGPEAVASRCDLDGRFEFGSVREGDWDVHVLDGAGRVGTASRVKVVAGESGGDIEIAMMQGAVLRPMHPTADQFVVLRGGEIVAFGPLERGLAAEVMVPPGKCTVVFFVRGRDVMRRDVTPSLGQQTVVDAR